MRQYLYQTIINRKMKSNHRRKKNGRSEHLRQKEARTAQRTVKEEKKDKLTNRKVGIKRKRENKK